MLQNNFHTAILPLCSLFSSFYVFNGQHSSFEMYKIYNNVRSLISVAPVAGGLTQWIEVLYVLCELLKLENILLAYMFCCYFRFLFNILVTNHCLSLNVVIHVAILFPKCNFHTEYV